ncbi:CHAT domain-containing protein [Nostoc parmelioides]|uniref:CHAT domain-containing protein n=1 Tax=Nostoc parmelioides FACHB-3921 TaxID=2692909 RepID=A0ABR8BIS6_9NOSO|nr:CHAT domain-containing protein [Nostoc parmelioides]MBD2253027.1 CHAT domain-containing protein [Nostoc parmelioides FACHB-3921]
MQLHLPYFSTLVSPVIFFFNSGLVEPLIQEVNLKFNYGEKHQILVQKDQRSPALESSVGKAGLLSETLGKNPSQIEALNRQAILDSQKDQPQAALQKLQQALAISREGGESFWEGVTLNNLGRVYQKQGNYSLALLSFQQAAIIYRQIGDRIQLGKTYSNIGYLFQVQNKPDLAIFFYKHCVINRELARLQTANLSELQPNAYNLTVGQTYRILSEKLLTKGRVAEAQRTMDLLKVEELQEYLHNVPGNQHTAKGIAIVATEKPVKEKLDQTVNNAVALGKELTKLRKIPPQERSPQQNQRVRQLVTQQQQLLDKFNKFITSPTVTSQLEQISLTARRQNLDLESINEIRDNLARLPQKSAIIYPLVLKDSLELVVVTPESPPIHHTVAVPQAKLHQTIASFRQALTNPSKDIKTPARQLYEWLIKPIEAELKQSGTQTLLYAPDGQLRYIPLSALYDGKQWLVERFSINHITAASLTNLNTSRDQTLRVLAGAFTQGSYQVTVGNRRLAFSSLPFAALEVENLAATIPQTKKLLGKSFSPQITVPQMDDYTIVHLATHAAFVVGKPQDSFILFGNGDRVNLSDIATWSLPHVDLVVLSACETGLGGKLGDGQEILGFGYQMQKTGAKAAIASLWAVDDGGTQALMSVFYHKLSTDKLTKTVALRQAQIALIKDIESTNHIMPVANNGNFHHPYYWASFILIGNGL